jgi:hypothetical protein
MRRSTRSAKRVRYALAAAICLLAAAAAALALDARKTSDDWVEIGVATDGTRAFVSSSSLAAPGAGRIAARQRFVFGQPAKNGTVKVEQDVVYECADSNVLTSRSVESGGGGRVIRDTKFSPPQSDLVRPDTLPQYIFDAIC